MGFMDGIIQTALPLIGGGAGAFFGGPVGALAGASIGTGIGNLWSQYSNLDYQKDLQNQIFNREDNATQRRMQDLIRAGLSPTLAAGSAAGAGSVVSTGAPQMSDIANAVMGLIRQKTDISKTVADIEVAKAQKEKIDSDKLLNDLTSSTKAYDLNYYKSRGLPTNSSGLSKDIVQLKSITDEMKNKVNNYQNKTLKEQFDELSPQDKAKANYTRKLMGLPPLK